MVERMEDFEVDALARPTEALKIKESPIQQEAAINTLTSSVLKTLASFPFWPTKENCGEMNDIVFWSENHLFMTLGSAYLYYQYLQYFDDRNKDGSDVPEREQKETLPPSIREQKRRVEGLLLIYLRGHDHFSGVYEVGSHIYLPYSLAGLLNLYDFSIDPVISLMAENIIDRIVYHLMLGTDSWKGVANLTASARNFPRARQRNFNHNINTLVKLMNKGVNIDKYGPSYIAGFLTTTNWRPNETGFAALHGTGTVAYKLPLSHSVDHTSSCYADQLHHLGNAYNLTEDELVPLLWSAGLVTHPQYAKLTYSYVTKYSLQHNKHLWALYTLGKTITGSLMSQFAHFNGGQVYLDIKLNVYKRPGLVLSSFELYNPHKCGFQQSPWMANIGGVPVWSRSGKGAESVAGFGIQNTHNPAVQQRGSVLLATYVSPPALRATLTSMAFSDDVYLMWPELFFERTVRVLIETTFAESEYYLNRKIEETLIKRREKEKQSGSKNSILNAAFQTFSMMSGSMSSHASSNNIDVKSISDSVARMSDEEKLQVLLENGVPIWQIGYRQQCFIALHVTGKWYSQPAQDSKDIYFQADPQSSRHTLRRFWTQYRKTNILVVMGHYEDYKSIPEFVDRYLSRFQFEPSPTSFKVSFPDAETSGNTSLFYEYPVN